MRQHFSLPALAAAAALLVVGCSAPLTPKQALTEVISKTGQGKNVSTSMKIDATAADLTTLLAAVGSTGSDASSKQVTDIATKLIPKTVLKTSIHSNGADLNVEKDPAKIDASFAVSVDGKPVEMLWVKNQAFLHVDAEGLGQATGLFTPTQLKMLIPTDTMPWLTDLADGKWVAVDQAASTKFLDKLKQQMASAAPSATPSIDAAKATVAFMDASEITKVDDSSYKVVTDAKKLIKLVAALDPNDDLTEAKADEAMTQLNDGANLDMTVTVSNGKVAKVVIDLADILRTWPKPDATKPELAKLAAATFTLNGVYEVNSDDPALVAPSAASTIPASDLEQLIPA